MALDKVLHIIMSFAICGGIYVLTKSWGLAVTATLLVGGIKELIQLRNEDHSAAEAWKDMAANAIGVVAAVVAIPYFM